MTTPTKIATLPWEELELAGAGFQNPRPETNPGLEPKSIAELAHDIEKRGLENPLLVWSTEVDRVVHNIVLRGKRRYTAIGKLIKEGRANGLTEKVPVIYSQATTMAEAMLMAIRDTAHGVPLSTAELAEYMATLKGMGHKGADIASALGKSEAWVSRIMGAFETATPELRLEWQKGALTDENAKALAKLPAAAQVEAVREHVETRSKGTRKAKAAARNVAKARAEAVAPPKAKKSTPAKPALARRSSAEIDDLRDTLLKCEHARVLGAGSARFMLIGMLHGLRYATGELRALPGPLEAAIKRLHVLEAKAAKGGKKKAR